MLPEFLQAILDWVAAHPNLSGLIVFLVAMGESLAVVGVILPGAVLLFAFGALIATGTLPLVTTLLAASLGAFVGDAASFWLGQTFQGRLRTMWPFSKHPEWIGRGERYFHRHGRSSIVFGRFFGPLRAVIPAIAGMMGMSTARFLVIDLLSALAWAPIYLFPGIVFGYSLEVASRVAARLAVLLLIVVGLLWTTLWLARNLYRWMAPQVEHWIQQVLRWSYRHPLVGHLGAALVDPRHRESGGLAILGTTLLSTTAVSLIVLSLALGGELPGGLDASVLNFFRALRTPWADAAMASISALGDYRTILLLGTTTLLWLAAHRAWSAIAHWLTGLTFGVIAAWVIQAVLDAQVPPGMAPGAFTDFPRAHGVVSTIVVGFSAILAAEELSRSWRWAPYSVAALFVVSVLLARLYLGAHWLSEGIAGVSLGTAWAALLGIAYRRHRSGPVGSKGLAGVCLLALSGSTAWAFMASQPPSPAAHTVAMTHTLSQQEWLQETWQRLPTYRIDVGGAHRQVLGLQWADPRDQILSVLTDSGFEEAVPIAPSSILLPLNPDATLSERPLLPKVHDGRHEDIALVRYDARRENRLVLRFWQSGFELFDGRILWLGQLSTQRLEVRAKLFTFVRDSEIAVGHLLTLLSPAVQQIHKDDAKPPRTLLTTRIGADQ